MHGVFSGSRRNRWILQKQMNALQILQRRINDAVKWILKVNLEKTEVCIVIT
jgi:hypothetical protein